MWLRTAGSRSVPAKRRWLQGENGSGMVQSAGSSQETSGRVRGGSSGGSCRRRRQPPAANRRPRARLQLPRLCTLRSSRHVGLRRRRPATPARCQRAWAGTAASNAARAASSRAARMVDVSSGVKPGADGSRCPASNSGRQRGTAGAPAAVAARGSPFLAPLLPLRTGC